MQYILLNIIVKWDIYLYKSFGIIFVYSFMCSIVIKSAVYTSKIIFTQNAKTVLPLYV